MKTHSPSQVPDSFLADISKNASFRSKIRHSQTVHNKFLAISVQKLNNMASHLNSLHSLNKSPDSAMLSSMQTIVNTFQEAKDQTQSQEPVELELYSLLSEQLMVSQSHIMDFLQHQVLNLTFTDIKTRIHDIFCGVSQLLWKTLIKEDEEYIAEVPNLALISHYSHQLKEFEHQKSELESRSNSLQQKVKELQVQLDTINFTGHSTSFNEFQTHKKKSSLTSNKPKYGSFASKGKREESMKLIHIPGCQKSAKFTDFKPVRSNKKEGNSPRNRKNYLLQKEIENLRSKLLAVEQERDCLKAWKANVSGAGNKELEKQQLSRSLAISKNKLKYLSSAVGHFLRFTQKLGKNDKFEDEKFKLEMKTKEVMQDDSGWSRDNTPFRTPTDSPHKALRMQERKKVSEEMTAKLKRLNTELKSKTFRLVVLEKELIDSNQESEKLQIASRKSQARIAKLEQELQDISESALSKERKLSAKLKEAVENIRVSEENYRVLELEYQKLLSGRSSDFKSSLVELINQSNFEIQSKYHAVQSQLYKKEEDLKRLKTKVKQILEDNLNTIMALNNDLSQRQELEELELIHEEKCHLEYTLAQNQAWAEQQIGALNDEIEAFLIEKQEYEQMSLELRQENAKLNHMLTAAKENQEMYLESRKEIENTREMQGICQDISQEDSQRDFLIESLTLEKQGLQQENRNLLERIGKDEQDMLNHQMRVKTHVENANKHIESLTFDCNNLKNQCETMEQQAAQFKNENDGIINELKKEVAEKADLIRSLKEQIANIGKNEAYHKLLAEYKELQDLYHLGQGDLSMIKEQLAHCNLKQEDWKKEAEVLICHVEKVMGRRGKERGWRRELSEKVCEMVGVIQQSIEALGEVYNGSLVDSIISVQGGLSPAQTMETSSRDDVLRPKSVGFANGGIWR